MQSRPGSEQTAGRPRQASYVLQSAGPVPVASLLTRHILQPLSHDERAVSQSPTAPQQKVSRCSATAGRDADTSARCRCTLWKTWGVLYALHFGVTPLLGLGAFLLCTAITFRAIGCLIDVF